VKALLHSRVKAEGDQEVQIWRSSINVCLRWPPVRYRSLHLTLKGGIFRSSQWDGDWRSPATVAAAVTVANVTAEAHSSGERIFPRLTFFKCLLTHLVKVFFWMASRSSAKKKEERVEIRKWLTGELAPVTK